MRRPPLPERLVEQAREYADGTREPVEPRNAATVVLLRDGAGEAPDVYLLRRQASMAFAAGMAVFPGGGVDPRDDDADDAAWVGPSATEWAERLGTDADLARSLVCAAVRETFEESGVLLAGEGEDDVVADTTGEDWERDRAALEARELAFSDFLARRGLRLRTDLLGVWSGWLTPVFEPRRYRTWFFVAALPPGQVTRDVSTESDAVAWLPLVDALEQVDAERLMMMPPTYLNCLDAAQHGSVADVLAASRGRTVEMFCPEVVEDADGFRLSHPEALTPLMEAR